MATIFSMTPLENVSESSLSRSSSASEYMRSPESFVARTPVESSGASVVAACSTASSCVVAFVLMLAPILKGWSLLAVHLRLPRG